MIITLGAAFAVSINIPDNITGMYTLYAGNYKVIISPVSLNLMCSVPQVQLSSSINKSTSTANATALKPTATIIKKDMEKFSADVVAKQLYLVQYTGLPLTTIQENWNKGMLFSKRVV